MYVCALVVVVTAIRLLDARSNGGLLAGPVFFTFRIRLATINQKLYYFIKCNYISIRITLTMQSNCDYNSMHLLIVIYYNYD